MNKDNKTLLLVGLGNPGKDYEMTFHNAGIAAIDSIYESLKDEGMTDWKKEDDFEYAKGEGLILVKPLIFMNESGRAVLKALKKFKVPVSGLVVIQDDSDIPLGDHKISISRGSAGHRGIESIIRTLKNNDFKRVRLGIRTSPGKAEEFVLKRMSSEAKKSLERAVYDFKGKLILKDNP